MVRKMRTDGKVGKRIRHKWGKIGAPHSAKRKAWLRKVAKKRKR